MSDTLHQRASQPASQLAPNVNTLWARVIVDELARCGLRQVCISPGSRSTPLVAAFAAHGEIEDFSIIDERSAAFFALGLALSTGLPVALVCTSGTAAANFFPAVCEASRSGIPLLVLTADRPPHLQDTGASQAMDQTRLYGGFVRWFHQCDQAEASAEKLRYARGLACRAFYRTGGPDPGPVHLNIPFRKPLEPIAVTVDHGDYVRPELAEEAPLAVGGRSGGAPFVRADFGPAQALKSTVEAFVLRLRATRRPLILAGADHRGREYAAMLDAFARAIGAPIVAEATSGLRHGGGEGSSVVSTGDFLFESGFYAGEGPPDLIVRTGRAPLSWAASGKVRQWGEVEQLIVSRAAELADPDHLISWWIRGDEAAFFEAACGVLEAAEEAENPGRRAWFTKHRLAEAQALASLEKSFAKVDEAPLSAAATWHVLGACLPDGAAIFVSNSMPIRDLDTFFCNAPPSVEVLFNRGVNGIDGIVSTGLAIAVARKRAGLGPTVIVLGDVALRHDLSALLLAEEVDIDATVVVIDNDGGAIFEYLPITRFDGLHERHFATSGRQVLNASVLGPCTLYEPRDRDELSEDLRASFETPGVQVLRVQTDRRGDKEIREGLRRQVAASLDHHFDSPVGA